MNWMSVGSATGYRVDISTSSSFSSYVTGDQNLNVGQTTNHYVAGASPITAYYYRVRAYNGSGTSANSNIIKVVTKNK